MFNIHTTELLLVCIVALLVIGPEKLPSAIKTASLWIGRFRRSFHRVKADIERELNADEIRRQLHNEAVLADIEEAKKDVKGVADDAKRSIDRLSDLDPGAVKNSYLESQAAAGVDIENDEQSNGAATTAETAESKPKDTSQEEITVVGELNELKEQVEEVADNLYGSGKNPKLAGKQQSQDSSKTDDAQTPRDENA